MSTIICTRVTGGDRRYTTHHNNAGEWSSTPHVLPPLVLVPLGLEVAHPASPRVLRPGQDPSTSSDARTTQSTQGPHHTRQARDGVVVMMQTLTHSGGGAIECTAASTASAASMGPWAGAAVAPTAVVGVTTWCTAVAAMARAEHGAWGTGEGNRVGWGVVDDMGRSTCCLLTNL